MAEAAAVEHERRLDRAGRRLRVMILVKATPQPSTTYGDTVCVAGVVLAPGPTRWVRLYPVPFRYMDGDRQFKKYSIVEVDVRDAGSDKRPESLKINAESLLISRETRDWNKRAPWVEPLSGPTMCGMWAAVRTNINELSLGAIRPASVEGLTIKAHAGWTESERKRLLAHSQQGSLFAETSPRLLEAPRRRVTLRYHCLEQGCTGHNQRILDWELTALQHRERGLSPEDLDVIIRQRFFENMYSAAKSPLIFVGNQESVQRRGSFTVLGTYYPNVTDIAPSASLF